PGDLGRAVAEDEDVVFADVVVDLDVGAVHRADGERAVECQLHVARTGRFGAGGGDLLGQIRRRHDDLRGRYTVVGHEQDLEPVRQAGVVVDLGRHVVDQLDDQLR